jgi:hypothetical protein
MAMASTGENPACRADKPYTNPKPVALAAMPSASISRRRRSARRSGVSVVVPEASGRFGAAVVGRPA